MILIEPAIEKKFGRAALKKRAIGNFLAQAMRTAELEGAVSVLLTGDEEIRRLNREFRQKDKATDVLSFPAAQVNGHGELAGDLAISVETAARQAEQRGHPLETELKVLLLHGVLHLAGWDHETDSGEMLQKEEALRVELGLDEGLILRAQSSERGAQVPTPRQRRALRLRSGQASDGAPGSVAVKKARRGKKR
ncbi:MAG: rRNA maturation RNase YbeY [Silvibacterium sp.]|nr:rRNA maturation RNase YbeY [Silvibacterium sp.]